MGTHSPFGEESHTTAHRAKRGPSLPRPQHGLVPSAKFLLVLHAFIYIHFPVHCEPSTPAEEKNLSKLPSQTLSQTIFHRVFQLLPQTAHVCFHSRKRVHTRLRQQDRTQRPTRRNTGLPDGAAITTLDTYCTFTNFPGPGVRTANFAALGSWSETLLKNAESLRDSDALMRVAVPRRRGPAGLRCSVCNLVMLLFFHSARRAFHTCKRGCGITTLGVLRVLSKRWATACQSGSFAIFRGQVVIIDSSGVKCA